MPARSMHITGTVQGVLFRASAQKRAKELGLYGWVRNTKQGGVEIHAEGGETALKALEEWCKKGPPAANVTSVTVKKAEEQGHREFAVLL